MKHLWALSVELPQSMADRVLERMPEGAVSQTAFKRALDDRSEDPIWVLQSFYVAVPETQEFLLELSILAAANRHAPYRSSLEQVPATGWIKKNEESYAPVRAGRIVIHSKRDGAKAGAHERGISMPIGAAFGTGEHPTTFGCLTLLQRAGVLKRGMRVLDIGTGTGILAFAAAKLVHAKVVASDLDGPSVLIARENAQQNGLAARVKLEKAEGFRSRLIAQRRPYDIILSNIFARPLARLAPAMRQHVKPGGRVILAGFLQRDENRVRNAYSAQRIFAERRLVLGSWVILTLRRPNRMRKV